MRETLCDHEWADIAAPGYDANWSCVKCGSPQGTFTELGDRATEIRILKAENARLRAALETGLMLRDVKAAPDPVDAMIGRIVALVRERDTLRDALEARRVLNDELRAENTRLRADRDEVKAALLAMAGREYATMLDEVHALIGQRQAALELAEQESVRSHGIIKMLVERE